MCGYRLPDIEKITQQEVVYFVLYSYICGTSAKFISEGWSKCLFAIHVSQCDVNSIYSQID